MVLRSVTAAVLLQSLSFKPLLDNILPNVMLNEAIAS